MFSIDRERRLSENWHYLSLTCDPLAIQLIRYASLDSKSLNRVAMASSFQTFNSHFNHYVSATLAIPRVKDKNVKGIPEFWLTIFKNVGMLAEMVQEHDEPILKHLYDVKVIFLENNPMVCCCKCLNRMVFYDQDCV